MLPQTVDASHVLARILPFIRERGYTPGERIPSERELAERFGVSRGILREALAALEAMRVIERRPQSGIYLRDVAREASVDMLVLEADLGMPVSAADVKDLNEFRSMLEVQSVALACLRRTDADLARIDEVLRISQARLAAGQSLAEQDADFHRALCAASGNKLIQRAANAFWLASRARREHYFADPANARRSLAQHQALRDARGPGRRRACAGRAERAPGQCRALLDDAARPPLHMTKTQRPLVLLTNPIDPAVAEELQAQLDLRLAPATDAATLCAAARDACYIVVRAQIPPALFDTAPRLRAVVRHGAGLDMIPVDVASRHGVAVANVPAVNAQSVAEYAVAQMLALARRLPAIDAALHRAGWPAARALADGASELQGKTLVVVGLGAIGQALARICTLGFGMQVIGVRRTPRTDGDIRELPLDDALPLADYLVLACPLTPETRGLLDARRFQLLKPGARLVNVARGPVLDEDALLHALRSGRLAGAALDVFATQPLPAESPLLQLPQVLATPHLAGLTDEAMARMSRGVADQLLEMLQGRLPRHLVNPEARESILTRWSTLNRDNP